MVVDDVEFERTPEAYFRWVASTSDGELRTRGATPASALHHLQARLSKTTGDEARSAAKH